jgi:hypothetical protein
MNPEACHRPNIGGVSTRHQRDASVKQCFDQLALKRKCSLHAKNLFGRSVCLESVERRLKQIESPRRQVAQCGFFQERVEVGGLLNGRGVCE